MSKVVDGRPPDGLRPADAPQAARTIAVTADTSSPSSCQIFISYRRRTAYTVAQKLFKDLSQAFGRNTIFLDDHKINPGENLEKRLQSAITSCRVLLVVVTTDLKLNGEDWMVWELSRAVERSEPPLIIPVFPCLTNAEAEFWVAWRRMIDGVKARIDPRLHSRLDNLSAPAHLVEFDGSADLDGPTLAARWELHSTELLTLIQTLRLRGVEARRPSPSWKQLKAFSIVVAGDVSRDDKHAVDRTALMVLGSALLDVKLRFPHVRITVALARLPSPTDNEFEDAASVVQRYITKDEQPPARHAMNSWSLLADWQRDFPHLGEVRIVHAQRLDAAELDRLCDRDGNRALITIGLRGASRPRFAPSPWQVVGSLRSALRWILRRPPDRSGGRAFDRWRWQWLAFPDERESATESGVRYRKLREGVPDATTLAASAWLVTRMEDHISYLHRDDRRGGLDFTRDVSQLLRALMLAPRYRRSRWRPLTLVAASIVATAALFFARWPSSTPPVLFTACGSTTVADEHFESDLRGHLVARGLRIDGSPTISPLPRAGLLAEHPEQRTYRVTDSEGRTVGHVIVKVAGTKDLVTLLDRRECDLGMASNLDGKLRAELNERNGRPAPRAREQLVPIIKLANPAVPLPTLEEVSKEVCAPVPSPRYDLVLRDPASGTREFLEAELCGPGRVLRTAEHTVRSNKDVIDKVAVLKNGRPTLGFVPRALLGDELAKMEIRPLPLSASQLVRDLYYVEIQGRRASGDVRAFLDAAKDRRAIQLRFCGSSSIGDDILPALLQDFVRHDWGTQVESKKSLAPHAPLDGKPVPNHLYELWPQRGPGSRRYLAEVATPGSQAMPQLLQDQECDIGMTSAGPLPQPPAAWEELRWGRQDVYALQPAFASVPLASLVPVLCQQLAASGFRIALRPRWSGTRQEVIDHLCGDDGFDPLIPPVFEVPTNLDVVMAIAGSSTALPVVGFAPEEVFRRSEFTGRVKAISANGGWRFSRELVFYLDTATKNRAEAMRFWDYLHQEHGNSRERFFLSPMESCGPGANLARCETCAARYPKQGDDARRLDADVVFAVNRGALQDSSSVAERILSQVRRYGCGDRDLLVLGIESWPLSQMGLDAQRASFVTKLLVDARVPRDHIQSFGVGADSDSAGRPRVEIWLVPHKPAPAQPAARTQLTTGPG